MVMPAYSLEDALKHVLTHAEFCRARMEQLAANPGEMSAADVAQAGAALLQRIKDRLLRHMDAHDVTGPHYDNGLPMYSTAALTPGVVEHVHIWHPDPANEANQPRLIVDAPLDSGERVQVMVTAPGQLDVVRRTEQTGAD